MPNIPLIEKFRNLSTPAKVFLILGMAGMSVVAWPAMVAILFSIIVVSTMQDKKVAYAMAAVMLVPALVVEGMWASSLLAGNLVGGESEAPNDGSKTNVAVVDYQNQVRGSQTTKSDPKVKVLQAVSGDTLEVEIDGSPYRIRLAGIEAPELNQGNQAECFSVESQLFLNSLLKDHSIEVVKDNTLGEKDENGNLWRYVRMADGTKVNELMLEAGLAKEDAGLEDYEQKDIYVELAGSAQQNNKGLWANCNDDGSAKTTVPEQHSTVENTRGEEDENNIFVQPTAIPSINPNN